MIDWEHEYEHDMRVAQAQKYLVRY
jgi:hypothetical protein